MVGTRCGTCGELRTGALLACPACGSDDVSPDEVTGDGTVLAASRVHAGSSRPTPFDIVLVETSVGLHVVGFTEGRVPIGTTVRVTGEDDGVPWFEGTSS